MEKVKVMTFLYAKSSTGKYFDEEPVEREKFGR